MANTLIQLTCYQCNKIFLRRTAEHRRASLKGGETYKPFCSKDCSAKNRLQRQEIECLCCHKIVIKRIVDIKKTKNSFCSTACSAIYNNQKRKDEGFTLKGKQKKVKCIICSKEFDASLFLSKQKAICPECFENIPSELWGYRRKRRTPGYLFINTCKLCGDEFKTRSGIYCDKCLLERQRKAGCASAAKRKDIKRSKNEILFAELCIKEFGTVTVNQAIFNGWDSDIQLYDYKVAIHWNGNWHYVFCGGYHSLDQVQARDKIKQDQIIKCGWENYIIEDRGKFKKAFVEQEFEKLKEYIKKKEQQQCFLV